MRPLSDVSGPGREMTSAPDKGRPGPRAGHGAELDCQPQAGKPGHRRIEIRPVASDGWNALERFFETTGRLSGWRCMIFCAGPDGKVPKTQVSQDRPHAGPAAASGSRSAESGGDRRGGVPRRSRLPELPVWRVRSILRARRVSEGGTAWGASARHAVGLGREKVDRSRRTTGARGRYPAPPPMRTTM